MLLIDLGDDTLRELFAHADCPFVLKLVCRAFRAAGPPSTTASIQGAVSSVSRLAWAYACGCPWDKRVCAWAAGGGHLAVLQWARENGCPWDEDTCYWAALNGHLQVLQWARANGCPWKEET